MYVDRPSSAGCACLSALIPGGYAPSIVQSRQLQTYDDAVVLMAQTNWATLNASNSATLGRYSPQLADTVAQNQAALASVMAGGFTLPTTYLG